MPTEQPHPDPDRITRRAALQSALAAAGGMAALASSAGAAAISTTSPGRANGTRRSFAARSRTAPSDVSTRAPHVRCGVCGRWSRATTLVLRSP